MIHVSQQIPLAVTVFSDVLRDTMAGSCFTSITESIFSWYKNRQRWITDRNRHMVFV